MTPYSVFKIYRQFYKLGTCLPGCTIDDIVFFIVTTKIASYLADLQARFRSTQQRGLTHLCYNNTHRILASIGTCFQRLERIIPQAVSSPVWLLCIRDGLLKKLVNYIILLHSSFTNRSTFIKTLITIYIKIKWFLHVSVYDHY